jgi:gephyrin
LCELFNDASVWSVSAQEVVPDEVSQIQAKLLSWSASGINFAVTTGGTGFAIRDVTPEAVRPLLAKEATGLQQLMMSVSLQKTPMAAHARPVAGITHDRRIIITVPGSPKGAKENVEALLALLPHALDLASGGSGKAVHKSMGMPERHLAAGQAGASTSNSHSHSHHIHHHHHSHGHNAPVPRSMDVSKGGRLNLTCTSYLA